MPYSTHHIRTLGSNPGLRTLSSSGRVGKYFSILLPEFPEENYKPQFRNGTIRLARVMSTKDVMVYREVFEKLGAATSTINYYREIVK